VISNISLLRNYIMKKLQSNTQKAVTTRYSMNEYLKMVKKAEERKICMAELQRTASREFIKEDDFSLKLQQLEKRLAHKFFDICCAVNGLTPDEVIDAKRELKVKFKGAK
jgi:hypothetical protein